MGISGADTDAGAPRPRSRRLRIALRVVALLVVVLVGLALWAKLALSPQVYDVASIREAPAYQDAALLDRAWALPVAAAYGRDRLVFQPRSSYCGPTSVANVLVSQGDAEATPAAVLDGTGYCWIGQCIPGLTLDELAEIARAKVDGEVEVLRDLGLEEFREHMRRSNDPDRRYVINFLRGPLFREGGGHHSPIGGYLEAEDLVFVLDVNADFQPWLVDTERLFRAMDTIDGATEATRGLLLIREANR
ncbi:MAG: phytochelatin synthase [Myxococcales bacterium]|nr:phytochelatin synthase [Myxococcales bacterium]